MRTLSSIFFYILIYAVSAYSYAEEPPAIIDYDSRFHPVFGKQGMVVTREEVASGVGLQILEKGGNAVDAAVAVGFALAVTLPRAGNLGGGGFMMVHLAKEDKTIALDYREMAPGGAFREMFQNKAGEVDKDLARYSYRSAGIPGTVAGLTHALNKYGTMKLADVIAPAIALAEKGFKVTPVLANDLKIKKPRLSKSEAAKKIFYKKNGSDYEFGDVLIQSDLAWSLKQISKKGSKAFYQGEIAKRIVADSNRHDGLFQLSDLKAYKVIEREPVVGSYRGHKIVSMPPPSSGGIHLVQMLNILEGYNLSDMGHNSANYIHTLTETMKLAYADRSRYLGDPDFYNVPVEWLTSKSYADELRKKISPIRSTPSSEIMPGKKPAYESDETTHYSVVDKDGNYVSNTYTLNFTYGSGIVVEGTGILLNNEMDDFSAKPGTANGFGLIGGEANAVAARKRPLSSMTPTIVFKEGKPIMALGSPGGSTIITVVLQTLLNVVDHDMNIAQATSVPRIHHQWFPDILRLEPGINRDTVELLRAKGHKTYLGKTLGSMQGIMSIGGNLYGASDPRRPGAKAVSY